MAARGSPTIGGGKVTGKRSGVLELAVLGLLHGSPMHGYELRKRLSSVLGAFHAFSYGSLYPCLKDLLSKGLIAEETEGDAETTPRARAGRRSRIVYRLTAEGKDRLHELLSEAGPTSWDDDGFGVHFAFFGQTRADIRLRILEGRRSRLEERMEAVRAAFARTRERVDSYTLELQKHGLESVEREVRWLNELIASERQRDAGMAGQQLPGRHRPRVSGVPTTHEQGQEGVILMGSVRVAIVGVGNCASSLVQGLEYYKDADDGSRVPGLMHVRFGPYHVRDLEVVAAFDVDAKKVGCDVADAISASENNTIKIADVPPTGVTVAARPDAGRAGRVLPGHHHRVGRAPRDVVAALREARADVLVCSRRVGEADRYYAQCAIDAGVALRQRAAGIHRVQPRVGRQVRRGGCADRRRRHQVAGRSDDHAPAPGRWAPNPRSRSTCNGPAQPATSS